MDFNYILPFLIVGLLVWNIVMQTQFLLLRKKIKTLFQGKEALDLEGVIFEQIKRLRKNEENLQELIKFSNNLEKMAQKGIQRVGFVRFNPFKDTGGNQSFSIALLDSFNDGIVLSTLFLRGETRMYAKSVEKAESKYSLSEEEKEAIKKAIDDEQLETKDKK